MDDDAMLGDLDEVPTLPAKQTLASTQSLDNSLVLSDVVDSDDAESSSSEAVNKQDKATKKSKKRKNGQGSDNRDDDKKSKRSKKSKKGGRSVDSVEEKRKKKQRDENRNKAKALSKDERRKIQQNCINLLEPYRDESVHNVVKKFIKNISREQKKKTISVNVSGRGLINHGRGGSAHFPLADGQKHLKRAGIKRALKNTSLLTSKLSEIYMMSLTTRALPYMIQDKRCTIFAKDVYHAQKSTGHAFV